MIGSGDELTTLRSLWEAVQSIELALASHLLYTIGKKGILDREQLRRFKDINEILTARRVRVEALKFITLNIFSYSGA